MGASYCLFSLSIPFRCWRSPAEHVLSFNSFNYPNRPSTYLEDLFLSFFTSRPSASPTRPNLLLTNGALPSLVTSLKENTGIGFHNYTATTDLISTTQSS